MVVFFDLDHTLLKKSSGELYGRYLFKKGLLSLADVMTITWWSVQHRVNLLNVEEFLERSMLWVKGKTEEWVRKTCLECVNEYLVNFLYPKGIAKVQEHRASGDELYLLSASSRYILGPLVNYLKMDGFIATELEVCEGRFSGKLLPPFCYGEGKLTKVSQFCRSKKIRLKDCGYYGDSYSDVPVLEKVSYPVTVNPDTRLRKKAKENGWTILIF